MRSLRIRRCVQPSQEKRELAASETGASAAAGMVLPAWSMAEPSVRDCFDTCADWRGSFTLLL